MTLIKDNELIESYLMALDLQLEADFLDLLRTEIQRRKIRLHTEGLLNASY
jgi:hypothetical protein